MKIIGYKQQYWAVYPATFICLKSTSETLEKGKKYVQS